MQTEVRILFSLILVRFSPSLIFHRLSALRLVIYYSTSILPWACMHHEVCARYTCSFVRRNTCASSTFVYTSHKVFSSPSLTVSPLFLRLVAFLFFTFFLRSIAKQRVYKRYAAYHGRYCVARKVILLKYDSLIFPRIFAIRDTERAIQEDG